MNYGTFTLGDSIPLLTGAASKLGHFSINIMMGIQCSASPCGDIQSDAMQSIRDKEQTANNHVEALL